MKSFTTLAFVTSIALTGAQVTLINGTFRCAIPDAAYCASDSLSTNFIIRCNGYIGYPGNCNDNLDGEPPFGLSYSPCFQTSDISGDAACTKNCIIYGGSGNYNGSSTVLPNCVPVPTTTISTSSTSQSNTVSSNTTITTTSSSTPITTITHSNNHSYTHSYKHSTTPTSTTHAHWILPTGFREHFNTSTSHSYFTHPTSSHHSKMMTLTTAPVSGSSGSPPTPGSNSTLINGNQSNGGSATNVPVGPTSTIAPVSFNSGAASASGAFAGLLSLGLLFAVFL